MAFHEIRFPTRIARNAIANDERKTQIVTTAGGYEERNARWKNSRRGYDISPDIDADAQHAVIEFFEARNGQLHGFRFKDFTDYKSSIPSQATGAVEQSIGTGDGITTAFQLVKHYISGEQSWVRTIAKPVAGTVRVALDSVEQTLGWAADTTTGIVTFATAPDAGVTVTAGYEFDVPVRFDTDIISMSARRRDVITNIDSIPLIEIRMPPAAAWTPGQLFAAGEKGLWVDPSSLSTLWTDTAGTLAAGTGDAVARIDDRSGNAANALQATSAARPILGVMPPSGRRNLLGYTEEFDNAVWTKGNTVITPNAANAPDGSVTADKIETTVAVNPLIWQKIVDLTAGETYTFSFWVKGGNITTAVAQLFQNNNTTIQTAASVLSGPGTISGVGTESITIDDLSTVEWSRISITATPDPGGNLNAFIKPRISGSQIGDYNYIWGAQAEQAVVASQYQKVVTEFEVKEAGISDLRYLFRDGVDDALVAVLPDLGTDATVAYVSNTGVTIQGGQTIGAGNFDVLRDERFFNLVVLNRALTDAETIALTTWLTVKGGGVA